MKLLNKMKGIETKDEKIKKTRYEIIQKLYSSKYAKIYKAKIKQLNKEICLKIYFKNKDINQTQEKKILTEISILRRIDHPCLLGCLNVFITPKKSILEMEYMNGGDLYDYLTENGIQKEETVKKNKSTINFRNKIFTFSEYYSSRYKIRKYLITK